MVKKSTWGSILRERLEGGKISQEWVDYVLSRIVGNNFLPECGGLEQWVCGVCGLSVFGTDICPVCGNKMV